MVDEVKIKVGMDTSEVEPKIRKLRENIKALEEDTKLLKETQVEYKEALAESGGKRTDKVRKLEEAVLRMKAAVARDELEIEKRSGKSLKNMKAMQSPLKSIANVFGKRGLLGFGVGAGSIYALSSLKSAAESIAREVRSSYLSSISSGLSPSAYSSLIGSGQAQGVSATNLSNVLSTLNTARIAIEHNLDPENNAAALIRVANRTGIRLTDEEGKFKSSRQLLEDIQKWVKEQDKDYALQVLKGIGITADIIDTMKESNILTDKNVGLREEEIDSLKRLSKSADEVKTASNQLKDVLTAQIAPILIELNNTTVSALQELTKFFRGEQAGTIYDVFHPQMPYQYHLAELTQSGRISPNEAIKELERYYGRALTDKEKMGMFFSEESTRDFMKQTKDEQYRLERALRQAEYFKAKDKQKSDAFREEAILRAESIRKGTYYKPKEPSEYYAVENGRTVLYKNGKKTYVDMLNIGSPVPEKTSSVEKGLVDKNGRRYEILHLGNSTIPEKTSSITGSASLGGLRQSAEIQQNFYGNVDAEVVKDASMSGIEEGFNQTTQAVITG